MTDTGLRINSPQVVADGVEGEVMVVNLETGTYYELTEVGADVWRSIEAGLTLNQCVDVVESRYEAERVTIEQALAAFAHALKAEGLVSAAEPVVPVEPSSSPDVPPPQPRRSFRPPVLEPFVDLQTLIQLDPILEQDDEGWPAVRDRP